MSTATVEPDTALVSAPSKTITFLARREELKLVLIPERFRRNAEGDVVETIPGMRLKFDGGILRIPPSGQVKGEKGEVLPAADVLRKLQGDPANPYEFPPHPLLGDREEGFWRMDEPAPAPTEAEIQMLVDLGMERDQSALETFITQESAGWNRESLLKNAQSTLNRVRELKAAEEPRKGPGRPRKEPEMAPDETGQVN